MSLTINVKTVRSDDLTVFTFIDISSGKLFIN